MTPNQQIPKAKLYEQPTTTLFYLQLVSNRIHVFTSVEFEKEGRVSLISKQNHICSNLIEHGFSTEEFEIELNSNSICKFPPSDSQFHYIRVSFPGSHSSLVL